MRVILPGSYDPITLGHLEVIKKASETYGEVFVTVFINPQKKYMYSIADRVKMISLATEDLKNVRVGASDGYVVDYMKEHGIDKIVKGYRNDTDLEYERCQVKYNFEKGGYETELWKCDGSFADISSTRARELIENGGELSEILPKKVIAFIRNH
jgi:pantetheine-phosphate adenylyltransferase